MRFARIALGLLLSLAGLVVTVAGAVAAFWLVGPDNTISTSARELTSQGLAVITAPDLLDRHGPTLHVTATGDKPLFVGVGQDLDVRDYLAGAAHTRLIRFDPPATFGTQDMPRPHHQADASSRPRLVGREVRVPGSSRSPGRSRTAGTTWS